MLGSLLALLVGALHVYFLVLEMFLWTKPYGRKVFRLDPAFAEKSATLAANQGLYNGFLAAGLCYGVVTGSTEFILFFLVCVIIAGAYGGATVKPIIYYVQAAPGLAAAAAVLLGL
ncbi:integral membrane protein [Capsaspora owczarzaki ATCC 30864]|uniref:Integral membrane protein n=1 Tax=Capsaspora owczarzaki (strain ATCC 30864) TaxID=595528 RepID=A0A0D2VG06_CAPO3|nr:integral membrane protein [Capsaspora owczarzaki ATCC 30864]KJE88722.1 integral membrane protein [Capsaspora owczarzaki ATCC 30864]|eukprot:XP_004365188.1 integral membrane protein [Capsaspora owczarzaki ATCC 30864]